MVAQKQNIFKIIGQLGENENIIYDGILFKWENKWRILCSFDLM